MEFQYEFFDKKGFYILRKGESELYVKNNRDYQNYARSVRSFL